MSTLFTRWASRWRNILFEVLLLKYISVAPRYGGELVTFAQSQFSKDIRVPTVYALLNRHLANGVLQVTEGGEKHAVTRGTPRKYYSLTLTGTQFLMAIMIELGSSQTSIDRLMNDSFEDSPDKSPN